MLITVRHPRRAGDAQTEDLTSSTRRLLEVALADSVVVHDVLAGLPPGTALLDLDRGADVATGAPGRLLVCAAPQDDRAGRDAGSAWLAQQRQLLVAAVTHAVDLIVYLPAGWDSLAQLVRPTSASDRFARLRPTPAQLQLAGLRLAESSAVDHAVLALALPGRGPGAWAVGQSVEAVPGCWAADSRSWEGVGEYNAARDHARAAGRRQLGGRGGGVGLVVVVRDGGWSAMDDPDLAVAGGGVRPGSGGQGPIVDLRSQPRVA